MKIDPYYQRQNVGQWNDTAHADILRDCSGWGHQMTVWLSTTAIFGDLGSYFFGNFRDKANKNKRTETGVIVD